jgi:uncharacterized protein
VTEIAMTSIIPQPINPKPDNAGPVGPTPTQTRVDPKLLELFVCPLTKMPLIYDAARQELVSRAARLAFPIVDGMPVLVAAEARPVDDDDPVLRRT